MFNLKGIGLVCLSVLMAGCNLLGGPTGKNIKQSIIDRQPEVALKQIKLSDYGEGDSVLFYLEKGMLHKMAGQTAQSNQAFELAKGKMEELFTSSVTQGVGSVLLNDNTTDYEGEPFEMIMAHVNQALNYMEAGNYENAAVIARQIDTKLSQLKHKKGGKGKKAYKCDPFADYLSGLIYESTEDWSSARVTYDRALKCYSSGIYKISVPGQLQAALVRSAKMSGASSLYRRYKKKFSLSEPVVPQSELILTIDEGFIVAKRERSLSITAGTPQGPRQVKIALPEYPVHNNHLISQVKLKINGETYYAERVHDLDSAARTALSERAAAIHARAVARAVKNQAVQNKAGQEGGWLGQLTAVVATNVLEKADVRGWKSLPHTVWMARQALPAGTYDVDVELIDAQGNILNIKQYKQVTLQNGGKKNLYLRWGATPATNNNVRNNVNLYIY